MSEILLLEDVESTFVGTLLFTDFCGHPKKKEMLELFTAPEEPQIISYNWICVKGNVAFHFARLSHL